jgi:hypothetical protein
MTLRRSAKPSPATMKPRKNHQFYPPCATTPWAQTVSNKAFNLDRSEKFSCLDRSKFPPG